MPHDASKPIRAIVSLVTSKSFIIGAEVLAHSLRRLQVKVELILLVTENVAELCSNGCGFDRVVTVDSIPNPNSSHVNTWVSCGFTKLRIWQLDVLLGINQVLYIDADCAVLEDVGSLFTLLDCVDFAAAPDFFPPDRFNAGVLLIKVRQFRLFLKL
uniref:Glycogenin n=1 Tax=Spongospora subterranea TaxID=70186 RepID=A0A0H5QI68_9EUKA|eukprot:CRZ01693.1 hypothetical protein [Spongospora subterranea]